MSPATAWIDLTKPCKISPNFWRDLASRGQRRDLKAFSKRSQLWRLLTNASSTHGMPCAGIVYACIKTSLLLMHSCAFATYRKYAIGSTWKGLRCTHRSSVNSSFSFATWWSPRPTRSRNQVVNHSPFFNCSSIRCPDLLLCVFMGMEIR